jgi:hypothetical protein
MMRLVGALVLAVVFAAPAAAQVASDSAFARILAEYRKLGAKPSVDDLVRLHKEIDDAVYAFEVGIAASYVRTPTNLLQLTADYSALGVYPHGTDKSALVYTSKLLREAHAVDPDSKWRSTTLYATVIPERPDSTDPLALAASKEYLDEFPQTLEARRVVANIAHLYDDLHKMIRDSSKGPGQVIEYRMACFKAYFTKAPLAEQLAAARDSAVRYYNKALNLMPQHPSLREQRLLINNGNNASWYFCND